MRAPSDRGFKINKSWVRSIFHGKFDPVQSTIDIIEFCRPTIPWQVSVVLYSELELLGIPHMSDFQRWRELSQLDSYTNNMVCVLTDTVAVCPY